MKMAFILMPMSFAFLGPFNRKEIMLILLCMVIPAVWSTIWVQIAYYSEFELFSQSIGQGRSIPTPINHIRYSVVIAISMIVCMGFFLENWKLKYRWERIAYGITAAYLFYFLHILSVRSGLALGYLGILTLLAFYVSRLKGWQKIVLVACIILAPIAAYKLMPGFQLKVNYTLYDLGKFQAGEGKDYSDSERWQSWHAGLAVGNRHPFFGTSPGRFEEEMKLYYYGELQEDHWTRPHNQWINVFAMLGLLGLIVFTFTLIYPMKFSIFWQLPFMAAIYIMQLLAMMVEHPLDTQFGTSLFLMMTLLGLSYKEAFYKKHNSPDDI
jgi:O-antigen ligase